MRLTAAVHEVLKPILNEMREEIISSVKSDIRVMKDDITEMVGHVREKVEQHNNASESLQLADVSDLTSAVASLDNRLSYLNESMRDDFSDIERELSGLNNMVNMLCERIEEHDNQITTELMRAEETLTREIVYNTEKCGESWGWRRAVYLDMADPNTNCPSGWNMTGYSKRTCGRASSGQLTCDSVFFPVSGGPYSQVCGRVRAYQYGGPDAFYSYNHEGQTTIDRAYVSGVAVMYGSPRQHIWTFACGLWDFDDLYPHSLCPCDSGSLSPSPPFIGEDYFCESGYSATQMNTLHSNETLWDGRDCHSNSTCCSLNNPPYFSKTLDNNATTEHDLELRICLFNVLDDIAVELIELYVK